MGIDEMISGLRQVLGGEFTEQQVLDYLKENRIDQASLAPYIRFDERKYTRILVHKEDDFEAILLCWEPGQHSLVHRHIDQLGWMTVLQGQLVVTTFVRLRSDIVESDEPDINWTGVNSIFLRSTHQHTVSEGDVIVEVTRPETIHMTENLLSPHTSSVPEQAVSLHVCWHPSDTSVIYDVENHRCRTVRMGYV